MRTMAIILLITLAMACKKQHDTPEPGIPGGRGGSYTLAVFPVSGAFGVSGTCYIKYGTKILPASFEEYDDSFATMIEPGYGPHAHFNALKEGFYAIASRGKVQGKHMEGDTLIEIKAGQAVNLDMELTMK